MRTEPQSTTRNPTAIVTTTTTTITTAITTSTTATMGLLTTLNVNEVRTRAEA